MTNQPNHTVTASPAPGLIVIGIDFGASQTAAAYAISSNGNREPVLLANWTTWTAFVDVVKKHSVINTVLYYDQDQKIRGWSEENDVFGPAGPKPGILRVESFKHDFSPLPDTDLPSALLPPGKTVDDVVADFLCKVRESVVSQVAAKLNTVNESMTIHYVITVPMSWNEEALSRFSVIARDIGFGTKGRSLLTLVSGPEAILLQAVSNKPSNFEIGDCVLVSDCGSHIAEMVTYEVKSKEPWKFEICTDVSAGTCGTRQAQHYFENIGRDKIRKMRLPAHSMTARIPLRKALAVFQREIIRKFSKDGTFDQPEPEVTCMDERLGDIYFDIGIEADFPEASIDTGYWWFTREEMISCFEPGVECSKWLIDEQIAAARVQDNIEDSNGEFLNSTFDSDGSFYPPGLEASYVHRN